MRACNRVAKRHDHTPCGTRAHNLWIRSPTPCPLGQGGYVGRVGNGFQSSDRILVGGVVVRRASKVFDIARSLAQWATQPTANPRSLHADLAARRARPWSESDARRHVRVYSGTSLEQTNWTHWGLNPGPSACRADVIPLHHVPTWRSPPLDRQRANRQRL